MLLFSKNFKKERIALFNSYMLSKIKITSLLPAIVIAVISMIMLYSAADGSTTPWMLKQILYFITFLAFSICIACLDPDTLYRLSTISYIGSIGLLLCVLAFGHKSMGAKRWVGIGSIKIQPSEMVKVSLILTMAKLFHKLPLQRSIININLLVIGVIILIPFTLIATQPDLATALICLLISGSMCFLCGLRIEIFIAIGIATIIAIPIIWTNLYEYQKLRILTFLDPSLDQLGSGYSVTQSKIAIGAGGVFGAGFMKGAQSHLNFLPENQTDFMFSMVAEELGLIGCSIVLISYTMIIIYGLKAAIRARSMFNKAIAGGASMFFFIHIAINAGMTTGLIPVAGIPMPLLSYGGSSVAMSMVCIGLMIHADINQLHEHI